MVSSLPPGRPKRWDDQWILDYRKFFVNYRKGETAREELLYAQPGLYYAQQIHERMQQSPDMALLMQARLLTGATDDEIAHAFKTLPETVFWYEKVFFNVRDFLVHTDWVVRSVLLPASDRFVAAADEVASDRVDGQMPALPISPHFDMSLKYFSYFGGPVICDLMISGFTERKSVLSTQDVTAFFDDYFTNQIRRRSAIASRTFEVNKYNVMELFSAHTRLMEIQANTKDTVERHTQFATAIQTMLTVAAFSVGHKDSPENAKRLNAQYDKTALEFDSDTISRTEAGKQPENMIVLDNVSAFMSRSSVD